MYNSVKINEALNKAKDKKLDIDKYNKSIQEHTIRLLISIGVDKQILDKWIESDIPDFKSADDFCRRVRKPHKFIDVLSREECEQLILAYVTLSSESNTRIEKSYRQMEYEYDYLYRYKNHPIEYLEMSPRTVNALRRNLNQYLSSEEAFLSMREDTIKYAKGIGEKSFKEILEAQRKLRDKEIVWGGYIRNEISENN